MSRLKMWPWLRPFLILVLVVAIPPLLYWFGYVQHSVQAAKQQAYITLSAVSTNFKDRLAAHDQIAATAERMAATAPARLKAYLESVLQPKSTVAVAKAASHLEVGKNSGGLYLNVGSIQPGEAAGEGIRCGAAAECSMRAVVPLENLIPWNVVETEFDGLLVLSEDGRLLAQDRRLPAQPLGVGVSLQGITVAAEPTEATDKEGAQPKSATRAKLLRSPLDFSDEASLQLAGIDYIAFTQEVLVVVTPVGLSGPADATPEPSTIKLVVAGLIKQDRLRREAIALSPQTLILIGALVSLGLFSIPFLKLRFIGARERMHPRDIWWLAGSLLCATALLVLVILDTHTMVKLRERFDMGLDQFSQSVQAHLQAETDAAVSQLNATAPQLLDAIKPAIQSGSTRSAQCQSQILASPAAQMRSQAIPNTATGSILSSAHEFSYPDFEAVFATDLCGYQVHKWMPRTIPTPSISIQHEAYFPATLAMKTGDASAGQFVHSSIVAPTSGLPLGVYAMPLDAKTGTLGPQVAPADRSGIIAIATPMRSVNFPVVAQPFQFVLVNRQGEVTFQQAQGPFRGERFFDSVVGGAALERAAHVAAGSSQSGAQSPAGTYQFRGRTYRMKAMDIPNLQVILVTYYDHAMVGLLAARVFSTSALFAAGIVASMLIGAALAVCWFGKTALDWAWPSTARTAIYFLGSAACIGAMVCLLIARSLLSSYALAWFMLFAPMIVLLVLGSGYVVNWMRWLVLRLHLHFIDVAAKRSQRLTSIAFKSFAVMAMLSFIAWPTMIVFNDAFTLHASAFESGVIRSWNIAKTKWQGRLQETVANVGDPLPTQNCNVSPDVRCTVPERIYASKSNYDTLLKTRSDHGVYNICADLRGQDNKCRTDAVHRAVPASFTAGTAYRLARMGSKNAELAQTLSGILNEQNGSAPAALLEGFKWTKWNFGGFALLLAALVLLVGSVAKHVLGVGLTHDGVLDEHDQFVRADGSRWLLLRPSQKTLAAVLGPATTTLDLRDAQVQPQFTPPASGTLLCIRHIECRLPDRKWHDALLLLLSTKTPGCIVMTSEIDPLPYLTQRAREKEDYLRLLSADDQAKEEQDKRKETEDDCRELRHELAAWSVALREVRKIREATPQSGIIPRGVADVQLRAKLAEECGRIEPLIEIGARLARRADLDTYRWEEIVGFVLDAAEPYYRSIWELCSREERLVLIQLSQEGLINPRRIEIVRRLARRGIVLVAPRLRLMNESFQRFVRTVETPERIAEWESTTAGMSWSRLGTPLYALAAVVIAILLFTEQAMFTSILAIATGAAGTIGSLRSLYAASRSVTQPAKLA